VVGTYRVLRQDVAELHDGFYTQGEYDIAPLIQSKPEYSFIELGRSCVLKPYRNRRTLELLWQGVWSYVREHGADVMKVSAAHLPFLPYQEYDTGHGKLSTHLDLRDASELGTLLDLARECDVFSQGYRPGTLANRGLSPDKLAQLRPGIICVSLCAFGHEGPWASRRGFDTAVQAVSGIAARQGELFPENGSGPQFYPVSAIDYLTGYLMAFGALVALRKRAQEGGSWLVRLSLAQVGWWLQQQGELPESDIAGVAPEFDQADLERWKISSDTPMGRLTHLAPVIQFSETPAHWTRPSVPLGHSDPVWPAR